MARSVVRALRRHNEFITLNRLKNFIRQRARILDLVTVKGSTTGVMSPYSTEKTVFTETVRTVEVRRSTTFGSPRG